MFTFGKVNVLVVPQAELIPPFSKPDRTTRRLMQDALDECHDDASENPRHYDWSNGKVNSFTLVLEPHESVPDYVIERGDEDEIVWGKCCFHTARSPKLSPFVLRQEPESSHELTIELIRAKGRMLLVRAYGGGYMPPLPWQASAAGYPGGIDASQAFWRSHAFVMTKQVLGQSRYVKSPPAWACSV